MVDVVQGRSMEVDAIVGNVGIVVALLSENGVETPLLRTIYLLLKALNDILSGNHVTHCSKGWAETLCVDIKYNTKLIIYQSIYISLNIKVLKELRC